MKLHEVPVKDYRERTSKAVHAALDLVEAGNDTNVWLIAGSAVHANTVADAVTWAAKVRKMKLQNLGENEFRKEGDIALRVVAAHRISKGIAHSRHGPVIWDPFALAGALITWLDRHALEADAKILDALLPKGRL